MGLPPGEHCFRLDCKQPFIEPWYIVDLFKTKVGCGHRPSIEKVKCANVALGALDLLGPIAVSNIIHACKRGAFIHKGLLSALGNRILECKSLMKSFKDVHMSMMINSLAMLEKHRLEHSRAFRTPEKTLGGAALFPGCENVVKALVHECVRRETFGDNEPNEWSIANIIHGLGWLYKDAATVADDHGGIVLVDMLLDKLFHNGRVRRCSVMELSIIVHGLGNMKVMRKTAMDRLCSEIRSWLLLQRMGPSMDTTRKIFRDRKIQDENIVRMTEIGPIQLGTLMWSLGRLNYRWEEFLEILGLEVQKQLPQMNVVSISAVLFGMAELQYAIPAVLNAASTTIVNENRLRKFHDHALANLTYSLGRLDYKNDAVLQALANETTSVSKMSKISDLNLANIVFSWSKLGSKFAVRVMESASLEIVRPGRLQGMPHQALVGLVCGFGESWFNRPRVVEELSIEVKRRANEKGFEVRDAGHLIQGFAKMGSSDEHLVIMLSNSSQNLLELRRWPVGGSIAVLQGLGWYYAPIDSTHGTINATFVEQLLRGFLRADALPASAAVSGLRAIALLYPHALSLVDERIVKSVLKLFSEVLQKPECIEALRTWQAPAMCLALAKLRYYDKDLLNCLISQYLKNCLQGARLDDDGTVILFACGVFEHHHEHFFLAYKTWMQRRHLADNSNATRMLFEMGFCGLERTGPNGSVAKPQVDMAPQPFRFSFRSLVLSLKLDATSLRSALEFERGSFGRGGLPMGDIPRREFELRDELQALNMHSVGNWTGSSRARALPNCQLIIFITDISDYVNLVDGQQHALCGEVKQWFWHVESHGWKVSSARLLLCI